MSLGAIPTELIDNHAWLPNGVELMMKLLVAQLTTLCGRLHLPLHRFPDWSSCL